MRPTKGEEMSIKEALPVDREGIIEAFRVSETGSLAAACIRHAASMH
jgi:hypothetical protein